MCNRSDPVIAIAAAWMLTIGGVMVTIGLDLDLCYLPSVEALKLLGIDMNVGIGRVASRTPDGGSRRCFRDRAGSAVGEHELGFGSAPVRLTSRR